MNTLNVSEIIGEAWDFTKKHWLKMLLINIFIGIVSCLLSWLFAPADFVDTYQKVLLGSQKAIHQLIEMSQAQSPLWNVLVYLLISWIELGVVNAVLCVVMGRAEAPKLRMGYTFSINQLLKVVLGSIIYLIVVSVGTCLCIIPGIYLACRLALYKYIILDDENVSTIDALKKSWAMTDGNVLNIILLIVLLVLIQLLGYICCCVGVLITTTIIYFAIPICYKKLNEMNQPQIEA